MKRMLSGFFVVFALFGCDSIRDMTEVFENQKLAQDAIKDKTGWESRVGFNIHNGVLTDVSVTFNASDVASKKVSELEQLVRNVVYENFNGKPQAMYIQIAMTNEPRSRQPQASESSSPVTQ